MDEVLKILHGMVDWEIKKERRNFRRALHTLIDEWQGPFPNFGELFSPREMDRFLSESLESDSGHLNVDLFRFVIESGYVDEPDEFHGDDGEPSLERTTPVHVAAYENYLGATSFLFDIYNSFDVNYRDEYGYTHFHAACEMDCRSEVEQFLANGQDPNVQMTENGCTGLHLAVERWHTEMVQLLVENGASVDLVDMDGSSPLLLAVEYGYINLIEFLLRNGADPNLADAAGTTPLHRICNRGDLYNYDEFLAEKFFAINNKLGLEVHVDLRDKMGRTPLQWAVLKNFPYIVDVLMNNGVDLASFVYPDEADLEMSIEKCVSSQRNGIKLTVVSAALLVIDYLEKNGYELCQSDVATIMKLHAKHGFLSESPVLARRWLDDEDFATTAKRTMLMEDGTGPSLYELIESRPDEAAERLTHKDYFEFAKTWEKWTLPQESIEDCDLHLSDKLLREFFLRWDLTPDSLL